MVSLLHDMRGMASLRVSKPPCGIGHVGCVHLRLTTDSPLTTARPALACPKTTWAASKPYRLRTSVPAVCRSWLGDQRCLACHAFNSSCCFAVKRSRHCFAVSLARRASGSGAGTMRDDFGVNNIHPIKVALTVYFTAGRRLDLTTGEFMTKRNPAAWLC